MRRAVDHGFERYRAAAGAAAQRREARTGGKDFSDFLLRVRRFAIFAIMVMAYFYYRALGNTQLAAIGLLSFAAIAQLAPAFFGGLFWRRGDRARRHRRHAGRRRGVDLHAVPAELPGRQSPRASCCCSTARSASRRCGRRRCSAPTCRRCCTACSGAFRSTSSPISCCRWRAAVVDRAAAGRSVRAQHARADRTDLPALAHDRDGAGHPEHGRAISRTRTRAQAFEAFAAGASRQARIPRRPPISSCCSTPSA